MAREAWEEVSFQVQHLMDGTIRSGWYPTGEGIVDGNIAVDFVWGNYPLQPDDDRTDSGSSFGGGSGDNGWSPAYQYTSDSLRISDYTVAFNNVGGTVQVPADSHNIADDAYVGYPAFTTEITQVPWVVNRNYFGGDVATILAGYGLSVGTVISTTAEATAANRGFVKAQYPTGDSATLAGGTVDLVIFDTDSTADTVVPTLVGLSDSAAGSALTAAGLVKGAVTTTALTPKSVTHAKVFDATDLMTLTSTAHGYVVGDSVVVDLTATGWEGFSGTYTITAKTTDTFTFSVPVAADNEGDVTGTVYKASLVGQVTASSPAAGTLVNSGTAVALTELSAP